MKLRSILGSVVVSTFIATLFAVFGIVALVLAAPVPSDDGSEPVGRWPYGPVNAVADSGGQLVFGSGCVLTIADASAIETLRVLAEMALPDVVRSVDVVDGYAYVADLAGCLHIIDVRIPTSPVVVGLVDTVGIPFDVTIADGLAFVADSQEGLLVIDVGTPSSPTRWAPSAHPGGLWRYRSPRDTPVLRTTRPACA